MSKNPSSSPSVESSANVGHGLWTLRVHRGQQVWQYHGSDKDEAQLKKMSLDFVFNKSSNPNSQDSVYRAQCQTSRSSEISSDETGDRLTNALLKAGSFYSRLQADDGHWPGDYGGPLFLLPGLIVATYVTDNPLPKPHQLLCRRYMLNHQNDDGGWGLHIEGRSTMFGTVMQYVALRLLGVSPAEEAMSKAREWIIARGGAIGIPPWGKFYLALLGVYSWSGCDSLLPEMWLFPKWLPIHPSRYWCHARMVYLPMSYCFGHKVTAAHSELTDALRSELYATRYEDINWKQARSRIADDDQFHPSSTILKWANRLIINPYERVHGKRLRRKALKFALDYVDAEDSQTQFVDIGPVNQVINSICTWHAYGKNSKQFKSHVKRWFDYLWVAEDGMKMNGYNGSQLWDTAFAVQAFTEAGLHKAFPDTLRKAYQYIDISQVSEDVNERDKFFRHASKGGWPFSTIDHGWPISDCTAEGVSATLAAHHSGVINDITISNKRLRDAVDLILSFQNKDGGWATYENTRGPSWLEKLNPSGIFGKIMIDYSYVECTSACMRALREFSDNDPDYKRVEINDALKRGASFILLKQRLDGSWMGSWAVCFTYGTWFGVEGLKASGIESPEISQALEKACSFLESMQNEDGGWGESFESCVESRYVPITSQVVTTAWAIMSLMSAGNVHSNSVTRGVDLLLDRQLENGDWAQEQISGVFNANCMITYTAYRNVFPIWALGRYRSLSNSQ